MKSKELACILYGWLDTLRLEWPDGSDGATGDQEKADETVEYMSSNYPKLAVVLYVVFSINSTKSNNWTDQARRETGKDMDDEIKAKSTKLNASIDNLKECTSQILAQVAALAKVMWCDIYF